MNLLNFSLLLLIVMALILLVFGLKNKSRLFIFFGVIVLITPVLVFNSWFYPLPLVPVISFVIADIVKKKLNFT